MKQFKFVCFIIIMVLVLILIVQNHGALSTAVNFKFDLFNVHLMSSEISLYYIIPFIFVFGVIVTALYNMSEKMAFKRQIRMLETEAEHQSQELNSLRNLPITSDNAVLDHLNGNDEPD